MLKTKMFFKKVLLTVALMAFTSCFGQQNLDFYIQQAQQNSPLIFDNQNQSKANQVEIERLKAFYTKPQVGVSANYLFAPIITTDNGKARLVFNAESADHYFGYDLAASNGGTYQVLLNVTQPVFNGERLKAYSEVIQVQRSVNENTAKLTAHDLEKIIGDQYILCIQDKMQWEFAESMLKLLRDQQTILNKLVESSVYKQSDLTLLTIEIQTFLSQQTACKANYRRDLMDLNILCGMNDTTFVELQKPNLTLNSSPQLSGFLEKYRLDSLNLAAQQSVFELKYKPQMNIYANTGLNAVYAPTIPNRFGFSAGINLTYNFLDGGQRKLNSKRIAIQQQSVSFYRENFTIQNNVRKTKIISEIQAFDDRILIAEKQLKDYESLMNSYRKEILSGQMSILSYVTILKNLATLQRDYTLLFAQKELLMNAYNYWNW